MKRIICMVLCLMLLAACVGCQKEGQPGGNSIAFYYPNAQLSYQASSAAITPEYRTFHQWENWAQVLNIYLGGPETMGYDTPFPAGLRVVKTVMENDTVYVTVSQELTSLTGLELTIACSCLAMTTLELTGAKTVVLRATDGLLGGQKSMTMDKNTLLLLDTAQEE